MKKVFFALALVALAAVSQAQVAYSATYDFTAKQSVVGVTYQPLPTQHDMFGLKGFDVDVLGFAGTTTSTGAAKFGAILAKPLWVSKETYMQLGVGGWVAAGERAHGCLFIGLGFKQ